MSAAGSCCSAATMRWVGVVGAFLVMVALVLALRWYSSVPDVNQTRAGERRTILAEARQKAQLEATTPEWIGNKTNGLVRLPLGVATRLAVQLSQDPQRAREEWLARAEKAFYVPPPPPPPPEPPNPFE